MSSPRDLVMRMLAGETPERVPFIIRNNKRPSPEMVGVMEDVVNCGLDTVVPLAEEVAACPASGVRAQRPQRRDPEPAREADGDRV